MHKKEWKKWCRLCGKRNGSEIDVKLKFQKSESLAEIIIKYFGIMINEENSSCTKICMICHNKISSIVKFHSHIFRVDKMFAELGSDCFNQILDIESLREKYGLKETPEFFHSEMRPADLCSTKIEDETEFENNIDSSSSKCFLKSEVVDVDETNVSEKSDSSSTKLHDVLSSNCFTDSNFEKMDQDDIGESQVNKKKSETEECTKCDICPKVFPTARGRKTHMRQAHSIKIGPPLHKCDVCGKLYKKLHHLNVHKINHMSEKDRKVYSCPECNQSFTNEWAVSNHIRVVHKKKFICELCGAAFGTNTNLSDHLLTHSDERNFKCPKCEKTFKCRRALKLHVDIHDDTAYQCKTCGLKLNTSLTLRRHMMVHSDQSKYKCNFCLKQFKRRDAFKNHLILHAGLKPYKCSFCDLTFTNGSNCRTHQKRAHPVELAAAELKGKQKHIKNVPSIKQLKAMNEKALVTEEKCWPSLYFGKEREDVL
ncbi:zinc finger protein 85-like isoform X2 [Condylostylus longicornis]|uniref:zinc finger protein 85-like isoform X2 n=1 Tax=Condylostylus longicornis TaxID=2530218 RepID=UPI00244E4313|nr:zinc finger protein 85-like isoform X2 [Condylostylus longicornis]